MPLKVSFDSNAWQRVVRPSSFPKDPRHPDFVFLRDASRRGQIAGFISETVGTLEAVRRDDRGRYFAGSRAKIEFEESDEGDGRIHVLVSMGPDHSKHPGLAGVLSDSLQDAFDLGFRLLAAPRLGIPRPPEFLGSDGALRADLFVDEAPDCEKNQRLDVFNETATAIEERGVGRAIALGISNTIKARVGGTPRPWFAYLDQPNSSAEKTAIQKAIGEWADGDAMASHIAHGLDVFCTEDIGKSADNSILDSANRHWLKSEYGVQFATLSELAGQLRSKI